MECPKCHSLNDADALFCTECGAAIIEEQKESRARSRKTYLYALVLIPVVALAAGIGYYKFILPQGIAAVVNGEEIKMAELETGVERVKAVYGRMNFEGDQAEQQMRRLRYHVLNQAITERLVLQEAKKAGVGVADQEIADAIEQSRQSSGMDKDAFSNAVTRQYGSAPLFKEAIRRELIARKFLAEKIIPQGLNAAAAGAFLDNWIQKLYSRAVVRITLSEQLSGAACGCCGSEQSQQNRAGCRREAAKPGVAASAGSHAATDAAIAYWHEKHGPEKVAAKLTDYGCHQQIDIIKDNKIIGSLRYQGGKISE